MGRFKDYMIEEANLEHELVELCEQVLALQGYTVIRSEPHPGPGFERVRPDLIARDPDGQKVAVEVKLYRSASVERAVLRNAISQLDASARAAGAPRAILVVSVPLDTPPPTKAQIEI